MPGRPTNSRPVVTLAPPSETLIKATKCVLGCGAGGVGWQGGNPSYGDLIIWVLPSLPF